VRFSVGRAADAAFVGDANVLDDWQRGYKLYEKPWLGEDDSLVWTPLDELVLNAED
jgi:hypothetical protein